MVVLQFLQIMGLTGFDSGQKRFVSMSGFGLLARKS